MEDQALFCAWEIIHGFRSWGHRDRLPCGRTHILYSAAVDCQQTFQERKARNRRLELTEFSSSGWSESVANQAPQGSPPQ